ncbi:hypothetical protein ACHAO4_002138 [Trichoderma viride]
MLCDNIHDFIKESYCEKGHLFSALKFFVDNGANINERNASGESLVHIAVKSLDADLLHALVLAGADVDAKDDQKLTPFHRLVQMASHASPSYTLQQLVSFGADACAKDSEGRTPLHLIAGNDAVNSAGFKKSQYLHSVKREDAMRPLLVELIDAGADVNATNPSEWTSLHYICHEYGREAFIQDLVRAGADINAKDSMGQTALHHSVESTRSRKLVEELIANGATIHAKDTKHRTPIDIILEDFEREGLYPETIYDIEALISAGAHFDVTRRDSCGRTPLYKATLAGDKRLAELLVRHGADINEKDEEGRSALHIAFALATNNELISDFWKLLGKGRIIADSESRMEFCGVLLDLAADVSAKTITGLTVLHIAADAGIYGLIERLVALGAGLDERDHLGRTPLFLAAAQGYRVRVALIDDGVNLGSVDMYSEIVNVTGLSFHPSDRQTENPWHCSSGGHGTIMANMILRINPWVELFVIKLHCGVSHNQGRTISACSAAEATRAAIALNVKIISVSWTIKDRGTVGTSPAPNESGPPNSMKTDALTDLREAIDEVKKKKRRPHVLLDKR